MRWSRQRGPSRSRPRECLHGSSKAWQQQQWRRWRRNTNTMMCRWQQNKREEQEGEQQEGTAAAVAQQQQHDATAAAQQVQQEGATAEQLQVEMANSGSEVAISAIQRSSATGGEEGNLADDGCSANSNVAGGGKEPLGAVMR